MAFGEFEPHGDDGRERLPALADINMTPFIDVMLVLVVVFILAAPLFSRSIALELPRQTTAPEAPSGAPSIAVAIDRTGHFFWDGAPVTESALATRLAQAAARDPQPEIALSADQRTAYQQIAVVMAAAQRAGIARFGFVVDGPAATPVRPAVGPAVGPAPAPR